MRLLLVIAFFFNSLFAYSQVHKSYEEEDRTNGAVYHLWNNDRYYKVLVKKKEARDNVVLEVTDEKTGKLLLKKSIIIYTSLGFIEATEKNGLKSVIIQTGLVSELRHKIVFGTKITVKTYTVPKPK